jgi:hypothetical protein
MVLLQNMTRTILNIGFACLVQFSTTFGRRSKKKDSLLIVKLISQGKRVFILSSILPHVFGDLHSYGDSVDREDENLEISKSTVNASVKNFTKLMKIEFRQQYLNHGCPTPVEIECSTTINAGRGFPGMFVSWDCKHFSWKNCPVSLAGQDKGKGANKTLILEAITDPDLYIGYYFLVKQDR